MSKRNLFFPHSVAHTAPKLTAILLYPASELGLHAAPGFTSMYCANVARRCEVPSLLCSCLLTCTAMSEELLTSLSSSLGQIR